MPGRPDDRGDVAPAARSIARGGEATAERDDALGRREPVRVATRGDVVVDAPQQAPQPCVGVGDVASSVPPSTACVPAKPSRRPVIRTPAAASTPRSSVRPPRRPSSGRAGRGWRADHSSSAGRDRRQVPERVEPGPDVAAPIATDDAIVAADGEHDSASRACELVGDMVTARPRADDEHAAGRQPLRRAGERDACSWSTAAGADAANYGTAGTAPSPVASTTLRACHPPRAVATWRPPAARSTPVTVVRSCSGARTSGRTGRGSRRARRATCTRPDAPARRRAAAGWPSWASGARANPSARCATALRRRPRSSTTWSRPASASRRLRASPACPAPMTSVSTLVMGR